MGLPIPGAFCRGYLMAQAGNPALARFEELVAFRLDR